MTPTSVKQWIKETKQCYNIFKTMPKADLLILAKQSGLDLNHYKTKSMLAKGMIIRISSGMLPTELSSWN